jgi:NADPH-dependent ferric siderophore reductase
MTDALLRQPRRVRHELKFRRARVEAVEQLTPVLKRIVLTGDELEGFFSPGFDDHVKIFPTPRGEPLVLPTLGPDGPVFPEPRPVARDYTPRAFDAANRRLTIDFAVGHGGPATAWAEDARPGDELAPS